MESFVEDAASWTRGVRRALEARDTAALGELADGVGSLEQKLRDLVASICEKGTPSGDREALLATLRRLSHDAHVCAALAESETLYLRWRQAAKRPPREYTARGETRAAEAPSSRWRV